MVSQRDSPCAQAPEKTRPSCFTQTLHRDSPRQCHIGAGDWAHRRHIGAGTVLRVASLASFEELTREFHTCPRRESLPSQYTQPASTRLVHHSHLVDVYRCHDGTATVLRFDWDGRPTVLIRLSVRAIRALRHLFVTCFSFSANERSALGRIHKRERRTSRILLSFSPSQRVRNFLPSRISLPSPCICRGQPIDTACGACRLGTEAAEEEADGPA